MARNYLLARQIYFSPTCVVYWFLLFVNVCFYTLPAFTFQCLFFHASYATAAFQCFIFYTSYVLFLFFMFVISTVFSLTHPLVLCNTFEYNFYSIFYNILLFQSVILANYICCKIYNICVVFAVYFSLYDPLSHFFYTSISALPNHTTWKTSPRNHATQKASLRKTSLSKNLTAQKQCRTKNLTTQNHAAWKTSPRKVSLYQASPRKVLIRQNTTTKKISPHYAFPTFHKELALHTKNAALFGRFE